jgi:hypothetical protein
MVVDSMQKAQTTNTNYHAYTYLTVPQYVHARSKNNKSYFTCHPKRPHHSLSQQAPAVIRPSSGPPPSLSPNLLLLKNNQPATTPCPERFTQRSANSDERRNIPTRHFHQRGTPTKAPATTCRSEKSIAADVSLSLARGFRGRDSASRDLKKRRYEIVTQRAIFLTAIRSWMFDVRGGKVAVRRCFS